MTLADAVYFLDGLLDQCRDKSIDAADLIEPSERDEASRALEVVLAHVGGMG